MQTYESPGVYVEEIDTGSKPIEGVSTSTAGIIGVTERGPTDVPILITSYGEYRRWFGDALDIDDFTNDHGFHCFTPHAVEGFFTNGGKLVYVTRVAPDTAVRATSMLFDRGSDASVSTQLLRAAPQGAGTAAARPFIAVLEPDTLAPPSWVGIGTGSSTEYREIVNVHPGTAVPLDFPLHDPHATGATIGEIAHTPTLGHPLKLSPPPYAYAAGDATLSITHDAGPATDLDHLALAMLIEIGPPGSAEYRFITHVSAPGSDPQIVTLNEPLARSYSGIVPVTPLDTPAPLSSTTLAAPASAGDALVFGADLQGHFTDPTRLVLIEALGAHEVRRIGRLADLSLARPAYADYGLGSFVERVAIADDKRLVNTGGVLAGVTLIPVKDKNVHGLVPGQKVNIGVLGSLETMTIQAVDAVAGTITVTAPTAHPHPDTDPISAAPMVLTSDAPAGSVMLGVDERLGITSGDVVAIGVSPDEIEYATVDRLLGAPGAWRIQILAPTALPHASGTTVMRQTVTVAGTRPAYLVLHAPIGSVTLVTSENDGFAVDTVIRVTDASGIVFYHVQSDNFEALSPKEIEVNEPLDSNHSLGDPVVQREAVIQVQALDVGAWGNRLRISIEDETSGLVSGAKLSDVNMVVPSEITLSSLSGVEPGTVLMLAGPAPTDPVVGDPVKVDSVNRTSGKVTLAADLSVAQRTAFTAAHGAGKQLRVWSREFALTVTLLRHADALVPTRDVLAIDVERWDHLSMDPRHSRFFEKVIGRPDAPKRLDDHRPEGSSWYARVLDNETDPTKQQAVRLGPAPLVDILPSGRPRPARLPLFHGDDAVSQLDDALYIGADAVDPDDRTGLQTMKNLEDVSIVGVPGRTSSMLQGEVIAHCEEMRYRFAVLDGPPSPNDSIADVRSQRQQFDTKYAALYHPWLLVPTPFPKTVAAAARQYQIPPSGHVVGVYARTDIERGVHKAPANEVVRGITGLRRLLNKGEQDILNPYPVNINVIRDFRLNNRGIRIWGGRVITSDSDWKYVNVRRLLIFIEHSIDRGLQWVVFEPNADPLWARVRRSIANFLRVVWRNGALEGTKEEEAFFVRCDRTTMTQTDIDSGRLIAVIGVAPVKPAEFVIIQIGLWTAHADS